MSLNLFSIYIFFFLLVASCTNPFATRDAEQPDQSALSVVYHPAIDPDTTLVNFKLAIENLNVNEYMRTFNNPEPGSIHQFKFDPEPSLANNFESPWSISDERDYFNNLTKSEKANYPRLYLMMDHNLFLFC